MTLRAEHRRVWLGRNDGEVRRVLRLGAVAGLACDSSVFTLGLLLGDIDVARFTRLVPGVDDGQRSNLRNGVTPVMPVLAKAVRDEIGSNTEKREGPDHKHGCDAEQMFDVLHDCYTGNFRPSGARITRSCVFNKSVPLARA